MARKKKTETKKVRSDKDLQSDIRKEIQEAFLDVIEIKNSTFGMALDEAAKRVYGVIYETDS